MSIPLSLNYSISESKGTDWISAGQQDCALPLLELSTLLLATPAKGSLPIPPQLVEALHQEVFDRLLLNEAVVVVTGSKACLLEC